MSLEMFRLPPGGVLFYRVGFPGRGDAPPLGLRVSRPDEGLSPDLELRLMDGVASELGRGRIPLYRGYLAVLREISRQLDASGQCAPGRAGELDFELHLVEPQGRHPGTVPGRSEAE